jgi:hydrogenase nickel incorporation protein HypA/HybF
MHEMSIAKSIIDIVKGEFDNTGASVLAEVELEIGRLAGVEYDAIEFALKVLARDSIIEGVSVVIKKPSGLAVCSKCGREFETEDYLNSCPACGSYACEIIRGKELRVSSILVD